MTSQVIGLLIVAIMVIAIGIVLLTSYAKSPKKIVSEKKLVDQTTYTALKGQEDIQSEEEATTIQGMPLEEVEYEEAQPEVEAVAIQEMPLEEVEYEEVQPEVEAVAIQEMPLEEVEYEEALPETEEEVQQEK